MAHPLLERIKALEKRVAALEEAAAPPSKKETEPKVVKKGK